jgi:hypothetical protein
MKIGELRQYIGRFVPRFPNLPQSGRDFAVSASFPLLELTGKRMDKVEEYERASRECTERAASALSASLRSQYIELAEMWRRLAEERRDFLQLKILD